MVCLVGPKAVCETSRVLVWSVCLPARVPVLVSILSPELETSPKITFGDYVSV